MISGRIRGKSKNQPRAGRKRDARDKEQRDAKRRWLKAKEVCRLSNGCHSPVYQCQNCPYRGVVKERGFKDNSRFDTGL
jgi:hypothetical protein